MRQQDTKPREKALGVILTFYALPVILLSLYSMNIGSEDRSWELLSLGILFASVGSATIFLTMRRWELLANTPVRRSIELPQEKKIEITKLTPPFHEATIHQEEIRKLNLSIEQLQQQQAVLTLEANAHNQERQRLQDELEQLKSHSEAVLKELTADRNSSYEDLQQKEILIGEYQQTITEQRAVIEKKQQENADLQSKVEDLSYEIKTLLQVVDTAEQTPSILPGMMLHETAHHYQANVEDPIDEVPPSLDKIVHTKEEACIQLKRCLDIAQKITGASYHLPQQSLLRDLPRDHYALDLRRLFENLRGENASPILLYSQKENKLLFVNNQTKNLLGWHPEKFVQNFGEIIQEGVDSWKQAISQLAIEQEADVRLVMKTKSGQNMLVNCQLATIPSGLFRNNIVGVLYPG